MEEKKVVEEANAKWENTKKCINKELFSTSRSTNHPSGGYVAFSPLLFCPLLFFSFGFG